MPVTRTLIKICGVTNEGDLRVACEAGADAIGFNFVSGSPRYVGADAEAARRLIAATPPLVWRFGLYDALPGDAALAPGLHAIQYYRVESTVDGVDGAGGDARAGRVMVKAYRIRDESSLREIAEDIAYRAEPRSMILLDAYAPGKLGGTGHTFNWELAIEAKRRFGLPIVLAGGLTPENVGAAVRAVRPYMVDVSSGVEAEPGRKDADRMRRFVRAVREADLE